VKASASKEAENAEDFLKPRPCEEIFPVRDGSGRGDGPIIQSTGAACQALIPKISDARRDSGPGPGGCDLFPPAVTVFEHPIF
jgi:hypothetical protein